MALFAALALVAGACGASDDTSPTDVETSTSATSPNTGEPTATTTRPPVPFERADTSMFSYADNLTSRVEDGEWRLEEGLLATMKLLVGEADAGDVLRHGDVYEDELTGVFRMVRSYLADGPDAETKAELDRLMRRLTWTDEQLERMTGSGADAGRRLLVSNAPVAYQDDGVTDCSEFFEASGIVGVGDCLAAESREIGSGTYTVYHPAPSMPAAGWESHHPTWVLDAVADTWAAYDERSLGALPSATIVLSVEAKHVRKQSGVDPGLGIAGVDPVPDPPCRMILYTGMLSLSQADFQQVIAHEMAHCFQDATWPEHTKLDYPVIKWWIEGQAEYLSNVVYPDNNLEQDRLEYSNLAQYELSTTLFDRAYSNFIFFQHLANRRGDHGMFGVIAALPTEDGTGRAEQEQHLARIVDAAAFHEFVQHVTDMEVIDSDGWPIDYEMTEQNRPTVELTSPAQPLFNPELPPFGVFRRLVAVATGDQACLIDSEDRVLARARPEPPAPWELLPPLLPANDEAPTRIVLVATSVEDGSYQLDADSVHSMDQASGGDVIGKWILHNGSVHARIDYIAPIANVTSISGSVTGVFREDGEVEVEFSGFTVEGNAEVDLVQGSFSSDFAVQYTSETNAYGVTGYEIKNEFIFYDAVQGDEYLAGTEHALHAKTGTFLKIEDTEGDTQSTLIELDAQPTEYTVDPTGWGLFTAVEKHTVLCGGRVLVLDDAVFTYAGRPDG